ncbi:MAG: hypothetical protein OER21_04505 [Gemmatimonadota bacterium]|nr:hypothetical protein [Gemmatimonadota bacterium]
MFARSLIPFAVLLSFVSCGRAPELDTRTFPLQYLEPGTAQGLLEPYVFSDRPNNPGMLSLTQSTVTVRETRDNLEKIARVLAEFDIPSPWVRLHFQIIEADGASDTDPRIADIETELRKLFRFRGYRLFGEAVVSGAARSQVEQAVPGPTAGSLGHRLMVDIGEIRTIGDTGFVFLAVHLGSPTGGGLMTRINARTGQTVVLGNAQLGERGTTTILTVRPELVAQ